MELVARLVLRAGRKHDVAVVAGGVPVRVHREVEVGLLEQLRDALGLAQARQRVRGVREERTGLVGLLGLEGLEDFGIAGRQRVGVLAVGPTRELGGEQLARSGLPAVGDVLFGRLELVELMQGWEEPGHVG